MTTQGPKQDMSPVGTTAVGVAVALAAETARPDRLFHAPLAEHFVAAASGTQSLWSSPDSEVLRRAMGDYIALRTRYFDDFLLSAVAAGCGQVVIPAAGLDTRAFRLPWPAGTRVYEVDRPDVLEFKETVITRAGARPTCERYVITADLREDWTTALRDGGFDPGSPTAWLVEGLIVYLSAAEANALFSDIGRLSAPVSRLGLEHVTRPMLDTEQTRAELARARDDGLQLLSTLWRNDNAETPQSWLLGHGWSSSTQDLAALASAHRRPMPLAFDARFPGTARAVLLHAERSADPR